MLKRKKNILIFIIIIIIIIIISFIFIGLIPIFNEGSEDELLFKIQTDRNEYENSTNQIKVTITLENKDRLPVYVDKRFDLNSNIRVKIFTPSNNSFNLITIQGTFSKNEKLLYPGHLLKYEFDLTNYQLMDDNGNSYTWSERGIHSIKAIYISYEGNIDSNIFNFSIRV